MNTLLYYLLQVTIASGILYLYYHIALRNKKFHQYNRFYLLGAVIISMMVPFFDIPVYFSQQQAQSSVVLQTLTVISVQATEITAEMPDTGSHPGSAFSPTDLLYCGYALLVLLAFVKIVLSLLRIKKLKQNNQVEKIDSIRFINTSEPGTPFSFFRWLFWNKNIELRSEKGEQIFRHELFHIQQKHSIDLLFIELLTAVLWINPFYHLMKKELRTIHEFLADEFAVAKTYEWEYAELLLMQSLQTQNRLVNPFFHNQVKRRIAMITNPQKTSFRYLRKLLVLPVAVLIVILFAFQYKSENRTNTIPAMKGADGISTGSSYRREPTQVSYENAPAITVSDLKKATVHQLLRMDKNIEIKSFEFSIDLPDGDTGLSNNYGNQFNDHTKALINDALPQNLIIIDKVRIVKDGKESKYPGIFYHIMPDRSMTAILNYPHSDTDTVYSKVEIEPSFPGGQSAWGIYLRKTLVADVPLKHKAPPGRYTVNVQFIVDKNGNVKDIKALTKNGYGMEEECIRVIRQGPEWLPAYINGKKVGAYQKQKFTFMITDEKTSAKPVSHPANSMKIPDIVDLSASLTLQTYSMITKLFPSTRDEEARETLTAIADHPDSGPNLSDKEIMATLLGLNKIQTDELISENEKQLQKIKDGTN
jgi:hypothetical protein